MEIIKNNEAELGNTSETCSTIEYSFEDKDIDLGVATITGRYPVDGYCMNKVCKELVYVLEGNGKIFFESETIDYEKGDTILIKPNEKYYWESNYSKVAMICTPAWSKEQYKLILK